MALYITYVASILKRVVIVREGSFKPRVLSSFHPLFLVDMFHTIGTSFDTYGSVK
jgi:hypothetical protein